MRSRFCIVLGFLCFAVDPAAAQLPGLPFETSLEGRVGYVFPQGDFASSSTAVEAGSGPSFSLGAMLGFPPGIGIYGAYQHGRFSCSACEAWGLDGTMVLEGGEAGVHYELPGALKGVIPWARAGVVIQTLGFSSDGDGMTSSRALGYTGSVGVHYPLTRQLLLSSGLRYLSVPAEFSFSLPVDDRSIDVAGISIDLGLTVRP